MASIFTPEEQKIRRRKMLAAAEVSIRKFVIECIAEKIYLEKVKQPNKTTRKAMENARKGKSIKANDFGEICKKIGISFVLAFAS